jgi:hypothetical protein
MGLVTAVHKHISAVSSLVHASVCMGLVTAVHKHISAVSSLVHASVCMGLVTAVPKHIFAVSSLILSLPSSSRIHKRNWNGVTLVIMEFSRYV